MPRFVLSALVVGLIFLLTSSATAQSLDRVLTLTSDESGARYLPEDHGSVGLWQQLQKLNTTASLLHILGHPDDEHGGVLTYLSRGKGVRTAQLTLNRGEGGANAIGPELFDALGLVRTEELLIAGAYYGLDDIYFTTMIDYGYSKTLEEAYRNWGQENLLEDVVRTIRINRPLVVQGRFHGSQRDGHGHHQAAGLIAQEAFHAAGDPDQFPEQITEEGLRPWQPLKLYRGGIRENETWHVAIDAGEHSPWLGYSYRNYASRGLSLQRSQLSGRYRESTGSYVQRYERMDAEVEKEAGLFDGLDTSIPGLPALLNQPVSEEMMEMLRTIERHVVEAMGAYDVRTPSATVPALVLGLKATRTLIPLLGAQPDVRFHLRLKERQFQDAINTALGVRLSALGLPADTPESSNPWAPLPTMGQAVAGQELRVATTLINPSPLPVKVDAIGLFATPSWMGDDATFSTERLGVAAELIGGRQTLVDNDFMEVDLVTPVEANASPSMRYFYRPSIQESRYSLREDAYRLLPHRPAALVARAQYQINEVPVVISATVRTREANLPFGYEMRELKIAPAVAVNVAPAMRIVPATGGSTSFTVDVELVNNQRGGIEGVLMLELPEGWTASPTQHTFSFADAGQRQSYSLEVTIPELEDRTYAIKAVAKAGGQDFSLGYQEIKHRDIETQYLYREATTQVRGVDVTLAPGLQVGYVMGVGDEVPSGIEQLGAEVQLLDEGDLATGNLAVFDAIVIGTRAYAVRQDLLTYNQRLIDYAHAGGNLIVLYQTPEFDPRTMAAVHAVMPRFPEEVSEEDAVITVLAPDHPVLHHPNTITSADFDNWVEQRGSKFFSSWDDSYTAMVEVHDNGQAPQSGAWVIAPYGDGHYTYFALAMHRQTPYGVAGAYRILANLLSL